MNWPDWTGETVLIAASGPSQRREDLDRARGKCRVVVINNTWRLAPWADALYACDWQWWLFPGQAPTEADFAGLRIIGKMPAGDDRKLVTDEQAAGLSRLVNAGVQPLPDMIWEGQRIGGGGNSGFQALNFMARCGVRRVILAGFDFRGAGNHWHGRHPAGLKQTKGHTIDIWLRCMNAAAPVLNARGVEVLNATRDTALACFPRVRLEDALETLGTAGAGPLEARPTVGAGG